MAEEEKRISLSKVLDEIASEMRLADSRARNGGGAVMRFAECELEFAIEVEAKGGGKIEVWIAKLGGSFKRTEANTLRIKYIALDGSPGGVIAEVQNADGTQPKPIKRTGKLVAPPDSGQPAKSEVDSKARKQN